MGTMSLLPARSAQVGAMAAVVSATPVVASERGLRSSLVLCSAARRTPAGRYHGVEEVVAISHRRIVA